MNGSSFPRIFRAAVRPCRQSHGPVLDSNGPSEPGLRVKGDISYGIYIDVGSPKELIDHDPIIDFQASLASQGQVGINADSDHHQVGVHFGNRSARTTESLRISSTRTLEFERHTPLFVEAFDELRPGPGPGWIEKGPCQGRSP